MVSFCLFTLQIKATMKKYLLIAVFAFVGAVAIAQDIKLTDSVIYFDKKPVAYYVKELNASNPHYNVYIIGLDKKLLIAAQVVKFESPVRELKSFYYYDLILQNEKDTFAIYHEGQAFTLELASLLQKYKLLEGDAVNRRAWGKFKKEYTGNIALKTKINEYETYLNDTRFFEEQVVRDRTKPITIVNDKILMQDGKKIGLIVANTSTADIQTNNITFKNIREYDSRMGIQINSEQVGPYSYNNIQVLLITNRVIDASKVLIEPPGLKNRHSTRHPLYEISFPLNKSSRNEDYLWGVCQLVENYLL
jgi:hypothetical protein